MNELSIKQKNNVYDYTENIINNLSTEALNQLLEGYDNDINSLLKSLMVEVNNVINFNHSSINSNAICNLEHLETSMHERLKIISYNYFKATCLPSVNQYWRNLEWGNMISLYNYLCILASRSSGKSHELTFSHSLWQLYRYDRPIGVQRQTLDNKLSAEGVIMCNNLELGKHLLKKIVEEININDILRDKLVGDRRADSNLGKEKILTRTGASIDLRSFDKSIRGLHPGWITVDDFLDKNSIYSSKQREKSKEIFSAEIMPALEPGGNINIVGTPFHPDDLYNLIREDDRFKLFEYPAIFPDGKLLAPDRYDFDKLAIEKKSLGGMVFSREYLCVPISDSDSIFPFDILERSFIGMETVKLVNNIDSFPIKLKKVITTCDLAASGSTSADFCAFITCGLDTNNNLYVIDIWHKRGASYNEQLNQIISINQRYKPNKIVIETIGFQQWLESMCKEAGLRNVEGFKKTGQKKDLIQGFPGLAAAFERGQVRLPAHKETKDKIMLLLSELNSISFDEDKGKLEASSGHDDLAHALFFAYYELFHNKSDVNTFLI